MTYLESEDVRRIAELKYNWDKLNNKTIFISGGTGFLGQFFIDVIKYRNGHYNSGIKVISCSRHRKDDESCVKYVAHDVMLPIDIEDKVDFVVHLASNTHPKQYAADPIGTITTHVFGTYNLLQFAVKQKAERFLLASSVEIYGEGTDMPFKENYCGYIDCNTARAGYNEAKRVSESLCQSFIEQYRVDCVVARLARCFGADRKNDSKAIAQFMRRAVSGEDIVLKSGGGQRFSFCYVADAVSGLIKILLDGECGQAYNISDDDEGLTLGDYARFISSLAGKEVVQEIVRDNSVSRATYAVLDCEKIKSIGWKPEYKVSQALQRTYRILCGYNQEQV